MAIDCNLESARSFLTHRMFFSRTRSHPYTYCSVFRKRKRRCPVEGWPKRKRSVTFSQKTLSCKQDLNGRAADWRVAKNAADVGCRLMKRTFHSQATELRFRLTSTVREAVEDVAFVTEALETAGRVDTKMVTGAVKRALVDVCVERKTQRNSSNTSTNHNFLAVTARFPVIIFSCCMHCFFIISASHISEKKLSFESKVSFVVHILDYMSSHFEVAEMEFWIGFWK